MKLFFLLIIVISFNAMSFAQMSAVEKNGSLHVESGRIVNRAGVPPQLRGMSLSWSIWQGRKYYNEKVVDWLTKDFKITLLRVSMAVQPDGGYLQQPEAQKKLVTTVIDRAIKNGIYVLIDWHDHNGYLHVKESQKFFGEMAQKYARSPNVIYEIWNEPERVSWDTIKNYAVSVISEIRKYDKNNLIVVGSPHWDQDVDVAAADPIKGFKNIAYSFHFYATDPTHQDAMRAKGNDAIKNGLPLFVTEWGVGEANGDGKFDLAKNATWLKWMEDNKLSWANWNITDKKETTAILLPGAPQYGSWTESQLNASGIYIRKVLKELNK
jgi:endoglucanase